MPKGTVCRERAEQDARHRSQVETALMRYDEVDAENRALRAAKYELEAKVRDCCYTEIRFSGRLLCLGVTHIWFAAR